jgi:hypothetical protein
MRSGEDWKEWSYHKGSAVIACFVVAALIVIPLVIGYAIRHSHHPTPTTVCYRVVSPVIVPLPDGGESVGHSIGTVCR